MTVAVFNFGSWLQFKTIPKIFEFSFLIVMSRQHHCDHDCDGHSALNDTEDLGILYSLYSKIDLSKVECLNEKTESSGKTVFKPWEDRLNMEFVT